jgi:hypothetical protein
MRGKVVQVHHPWDFFSQPYCSCSGNSYLTLSSVSYIVKLEMFAVSGRRWLQRGVAHGVLHNIKMCRLSQVRTKIFFSFFTS